MPHIPQDVFAHILSYCNDPLTLYKNKHREQWRRIRVLRVRHLARPADESDEDESDEYESDDDPWYWGVAYVLTPYVDKRPCNSAKMALDPLSFVYMFDFLKDDEDWPTVFYDTREGDDIHRYNYEVNYRGELTYKELCKQEYDAYMLRCHKCTHHTLN
jgi:hypothetical protein